MVLNWKIACLRYFNMSPCPLIGIILSSTIFIYLGNNGLLNYLYLIRSFVSVIFNSTFKFLSSARNSADDR